MEFERAARGDLTYGPESGKAIYPWGDTAPSTDTYSYNDGSGSATYGGKYYANWDVNGSSNTPERPIDVGHYLRGDITRTDAQTGASIYGVTDLAGNNWEHLINCASTSTPTSGNGSVITGSSPNYGAFNWPGASSGKGVRGGSWGDGSSFLPVSVRHDAGWAGTSRHYRVGFRPAWTP